MKRSRRTKALAARDCADALIGKLKFEVMRLETALEVLLARPASGAKDVGDLLECIAATPPFVATGARPPHAQAPRPALTHS